MERPGRRAAVPPWSGGLHRCPAPWASGGVGTEPGARLRAPWGTEPGHASLARFPMQNGEGLCSPSPAAIRLAAEEHKTKQALGLHHETLQGARGEAGNPIPIRSPRPLPDAVVGVQAVYRGVPGLLPAAHFHPDSRSSPVLNYLLRKALPDLPTPSATSRAHHSCLLTHTHLTAPKRHLVICACACVSCPGGFRDVNFPHGTEKGAQPRSQLLPGSWPPRTPPR